MYVCVCVCVYAVCSELEYDVFLDQLSPEHVVGAKNPTFVSSVSPSSQYESDVDCIHACMITSHSTCYLKYIVSQ